MTPPADENRRCPQCGRAISRQAIICPACGMAVPDTIPWAPPAVDRKGIAQDSKERQKQMWAGIGAASLAATVLILCNRALVAWIASAETILVASDFTLVPFVMGIVSAFFWKKLSLTTLQYFVYSLLSSVVGLLIGSVFMGEGAICLLIVSPLLIILNFAGSLAGRWLFHWDNNRLNLTLIPLIVLAMGCDLLSPHHYRNCVTDRVLIHATPARVWPFLARFPPIRERPRFWLFRAGLPYPVQSTVDRAGTGAARQCIFQGGHVFEERIVEWQPNERLTFDIVAQPKDPEILGHAAVRRGQFVLEDNGDGTTTLVGRSWYELYVYPSWYYDLWARSIARNVHLRVMNHIRDLCEGQTPRKASGHVRLGPRPSQVPAASSGTSTRL